VGRYSVLSCLGRGGMGVVYKAYDPQLDRNVALKLLRASSSGPGASLRLLREARTLAKLKHPNVVAVYDTGLSPHGVFIAMELLDGSNLSQWLRARPRRMIEVLHVFREAARGLMAAHEAGFVHRDFKPSNVFVSTDGSIRVLDFGLAHSVESGVPSERVPVDEPSAADQDSGERFLQETLGYATRPSGTQEVFTTEAGTVVGTPAFMAPEELTHGRSDHRSEQYAFAMSLYVCLYECSPPGGKSYEARLASVEEGLTLTESDLERSASGESVPPRLRRAILRALAIEPERRFATMAELLAQLEPPTRRWRELAAAVTLVMSFGAGAALFSPGEPESQPCRDLAAALGSAWDDEDRDALDAAFARADRTELRAQVEQRFDAYAASWAEMYEQSCRATFVEQQQSERLFDQRMRCLERRRNRLRSAVDSLVEAETSSELVARLIVPYKLPPIEPCGDLEAVMEELPLPEEPEVRRQVAGLRHRLDEAETNLHAGDYPMGIELARAVVDEADGLGYDPLLAEALGLLGRLQVEGAGAADAEQTLRRAIEVGARVRDLRTVATAWTELLFALGRQRRLEEGLLLELSARAAVSMADDEVVRAWLLNSLAFLHSESGETERAREYLEEALEIKRAELGEDHVDVGISWYNLGNTLVDERRLEEAADALERSREIYEMTVGLDHPLSHFALSGLCRVEQQRGNPEAAVSLCKEVLMRFEDLPPSPMWSSRVSFVLAKAQWELGEADAAYRSARRAQQIIAEENPEAAVDIDRWISDPDGLELEVNGDDGR